MNQELRQRREALGLTRKELARILLITERTLQRWEADQIQNLHPLLRNGWMAALEAIEKEREEGV